MLDLQGNDTLNRIMRQMAFEETERKRREQMLMSSTPQMQQPSATPLDEEKEEPEQNMLSKVQDQRNAYTEMLLSNAKKTPGQIAAELKAQIIGDVDKDGNPVKRGALRKFGRALKGFDYAVQGTDGGIQRDALALQQKYQDRANTALTQESSNLLKDAELREKSIANKNKLTMAADANSTKKQIAEQQMLGKITGIDLTNNSPVNLARAKAYEAQATMAMKKNPWGPINNPSAAWQFIQSQPKEEQLALEENYRQHMKTLGVDEAAAKALFPKSSSAGGVTNSSREAVVKLADGQEGIRTLRSQSQRSGGDQQQGINPQAAGILNLPGMQSATPSVTPGAQQPFPQQMSQPPQPQPPQQPPQFGNPGGSRPFQPSTLPESDVERRQNNARKLQGNGFSIIRNPLAPRISPGSMTQEGKNRLTYEGESKEFAVAAGEAYSDGGLSKIAGPGNNLASSLGKAIETFRKIKGSDIHNTSDTASLSNALRNSFGGFDQLPDKTKDFLRKLTLNVSSMQFRYQKEMSGLTVLGKEMDKIAERFPNLLNSPQQIVLGAAALAMKHQAENTLMDAGYSADDFKAMLPEITTAIDDRVTKLLKDMPGQLGKKGKIISYPDIDLGNLLGERWKRANKPDWPVYIRELSTGGGSKNTNSPSKKKSLWEAVGGR